uniref:glutaredoxin-like protein C5orf63 homolog n=1 Tax=Myxine glutinosa TaxID=7769 RepID=UPI00358F87A8
MMAALTWNTGRGLVVLGQGLSTIQHAGHLPVLTLFTKKMCPLCDEAKEELKPYKKRLILEEVYIDRVENSSWYGKYKNDIPVFHLNGQFLMKHHIDKRLLEKSLEKLENPPEGNSNHSSIGQGPTS